MKKYILYSLALLFASQAHAQLKAKLADKHFNELAYVEAAPMYDELADKFIAEKKGNQLYILRAAISNAKIYKYKKSVGYFAQLKNIDPKALSEQNYSVYIDELRILQRYKESISIAQTAADIYPNNSYFKTIKNSEGEITAIKTRGKFNTIKVMSFNSGMGDFAPTQYEDSLLFATRAFHRGFLSGRYAWDNGYFTKMAYTTYKDGEWSKPKAIGGVFSSRKHDGPVAFSPDGKTMVLTRDLGKDVVKKKGMHRLALFISQKDSEGKWGKLQRFEYSPASSNNGHASFSSDGKRIYFSSDREGSVGGADIYYSDYQNGKWQEPVNLKNVNTTGDELFPYASGHKLYFASDGHAGMGGLDIYVVNLNNTEATPQNIGSKINSPADDFGLIVDKNSAFKGYFTSNRTGWIDRIYSWSSKVPSVQLKVNVLANYSKAQPLGNQMVKLINTETNDTLTLTTDEKGAVQTALNNGNSYKLITKKENFKLETPITFNTNGLVGDTMLNYTLNLNPLFATASIYVYNKKSADPIKDAAVKIYDANSKKDTVLMTDQDGYVHPKIDRNSAFKLSVTKDGFMDNVSVFTSSRTQDKVELKIPLTKIEKGLTFKVDNIYYDLNSSVLRPESKLSLDTLAMFIEKNHVKVELSAHTDSRGSNKYNMWLSQRRAQSCVNYLTKVKGISKAMIIAKGYGETKPVNGCVDGVPCTDEQYQANRRTEVKILEVMKQ